MLINKKLLDNYIEDTIEQKETIYNKMKKLDKRTKRYKNLEHDYFMLEGKLSAYNHLKFLLKVNIIKGCKL